jgi:hypothetical protein
MIGGKNNVSLVLKLLDRGGNQSIGNANNANRIVLAAFERRGWNGDGFCNLEIYMMNLSFIIDR